MVCLIMVKIVLEEFGRVGDKNEKWGCSVRIPMTPIVNYEIGVFFEYNHWVFRKSDN